MARLERGQTTVELALCLPFFVLLIAAFVQAAIVAVDQARLWHAAREAARVAVVQPDAAQARDAAIATGLHPIAISIRPPEAYRRMGEPLTVALAFHPSGGVPLLSGLFDGITLHATATMRIEQP